MRQFVDFRASRFSHVTPLSRQLQWFPIPESVELTLALLSHACRRGAAPSYLANEVSDVSTLLSRRRRGSASAHLLVWTGGSVLGRLDPDGSGIFAECTSCSIFFSFSFSLLRFRSWDHPSCPSWTLSHHFSRSFSSVRILSDSPCALIILSFFSLSHLRDVPLARYVAHGERSSRASATQTWNKFPSYLRKEASQACFQRLLKPFVLQCVSCTTHLGFINRSLLISDFISLIFIFICSDIETT